jgi:rhodanese-related sulfurtransferase
MTQKFPAIIRDTAILLVASAFLAFAYNAFSSKRLPWVRVASDRIMASDSLINTLATASQQATPPQASISPASSQPSVAITPNNDSLKAAQKLTSKKDSLKASQNLASKKEATKPNTDAESAPATQPSEQAASLPAASGNSNKPLEIRIDQVEKLLTNPDVLVIDARKSNEFEKGHIGNAINIFTPEFEQNIPRIIGLPREKPIVVYCGGGACELSHELAGHLVGLGFKRVFVYTGGWNEWQLKKG